MAGAPGSSTTSSLKVGLEVKGQCEEYHSTVPGTVLLDKVFTGDIPTERGHNDHLLVQGRAKFLPHISHQQMLIQIFLCSVTKTSSTCPGPIITSHHSPLEHPLMHFLQDCHDLCSCPFLRIGLLLACVSSHAHQLLLFHLARTQFHTHWDTLKKQAGVG